MIKLTLFQKITLRISGHVSVGPRMKAGWRAPINHFAFKCPVHGLVVDYPHGYSQQLTCPECQTIES